MPEDVKPEEIDIAECGGYDFLSSPLILVENGKYLLSVDKKKVTMFSTQTGLPIKTIHTGEMLSICESDVEDEFLVANTKCVTRWNFRLAKIVKKQTYSFCEPGNIISVHLPKDFCLTAKVYITVGGANNKIFRVNVLENKSNLIFTGVVNNTFHIGDNNNSLVTLAYYQGVSCELLCYDKGQAIIQKFQTDINRPFTIIRCHPKEKSIACGDKLGRILIFSNIGVMESIKPAKQILHWHTLPVSGLCWSLEGTHLYSGGGEHVLCKWFPETSSKPTFIPRMNSAIVNIQVSESVSSVVMGNNSIVILDNHGLCIAELSGLGKNLSGWPAGLVWDPRTQSLMMNGMTGHIQVFNPETKATHSIDITIQNYLTNEREKNPMNAEVTKLSLSSCGMYLATIDCCWTPVLKINLKFWHFDQGTQKFTLNTLVQQAHVSGVLKVIYHRSVSRNTPSLLSVGCDKKAKIWSFNNKSWSCLYSLEFRDLNCITGTWSDDASVIAVSFDQLITLWDQQARLKTTLSTGETKKTVNCIEFGKGIKKGFYLFAATNSELIMWNVLTLCKLIVIPLERGPLNLTVDPVTGYLAIITKDNISVVDTVKNRMVCTFHDVNCTGGAAYAPIGDTSILYYLTFDGLIRSIGTKTNSRVLENVRISDKPNNLFFATQKSKANPVEISSEIHRQSDDIECLLTVPLHTVPASSKLLENFLSNRNRNFPMKQIVVSTCVQKKSEEESVEQEQKIKQIFSSESRDVLKNSFAKYFR